MKSLFPSWWLLLAIVAGLAVVPAPAPAAEPLPPEIEAASLEERNAYRQRLARESLEQKISTGRQRWDQRMAYKHAVVQHLQAESAARAAYFKEENAAPAAVPPESNTSQHVMVLLAVAALAWLAMRLRRQAAED